ncbi:MAG: hypothetical protein NC115_01795 [Bacteroidales bacterium]|nr:hypothetical protein [Bacteroidales bacterium]
MSKIVEHNEIIEQAFGRFNFAKAGAYRMAYDIADLITGEQLCYYHNILTVELQSADESRLIMQMIETNRTLSLAEVSGALTTISNIFKTRLDDD